MEKFLPCTPSVLPSEAGTRGARRMRPPRPRPSWSSPLAGRAAPSGPARGSLRGTAAAGHRKEGPAARTTSRSARVTRGRALMSPAAPVAGELARQRPPHVYHHRAAAGCGGWRAAAAPVAATTVAAAVARTVCMLGNAPESTCAHGHGSRFLAAVQSQCKSTPAVPCSSPLAPRAPRGRHRRHRCRCLPSSSTTEPVRLAPPSPLRMPLFSFVFLVCLASTPPRLPRCPVHPSWLSSLANAAAAATTTTATSTPTVVPSPPPHRVFVGWGAGGELGLGRRSWGGEGRQSATPAACAGRWAAAPVRRCGWPPSARSTWASSACTWRWWSGPSGGGGATSATGTSFGAPGGGCRGTCGRGRGRRGSRRGGRCRRRRHPCQRHPHLHCRREERRRRRQRGRHQGGGRPSGQVGGGGRGGHLVGLEGGTGEVWYGPWLGGAGRWVGGRGGGGRQLPWRAVEQAWAGGVAGTAGQTGGGRRGWRRRRCCWSGARMGRGTSTKGGSP